MDWKATLEEILAERRQQLGKRPSADDFIALRAGDLSDDDRQRLLEHAAVDPAVARDLFDILRFPELPEDEDLAPDEARPHEEGVSQRWLALRDRLVEEGELPSQDAPEPEPKPLPSPFRPTWLPLAAMFLLGVGVAWLLGRLPDSHEPAADPRLNLPIVELLPEGDDATGPRGSAERATVAADAGGLVLTLAVPELPPSPDRGPYSLELRRPDGSSQILAGLSPGPGGVFVLALSREDWRDGLHDLQLRDRRGQPVAHFQLEVELRR